VVAGGGRSLETGSTSKGRDRSAIELRCRNMGSQARGSVKQSIYNGVSREINSSDENFKNYCQCQE